MTEWGVVGVIIALVGLISTLIKPFTSLTRSITELTVVVGELKDDMDDYRASNHESHRRIWEHNDTQDKRLTEFEGRISKLEGSK